LDQVKINSANNVYQVKHKLLQLFELHVFVTGCWIGL